jgi:hypothetical protein
VNSSVERLAKYLYDEAYPQDKPFKNYPERFYDKWEERRDQYMWRNKARTLLSVALDVELPHEPERFQVTS